MILISQLGNKKYGLQSLQKNKKYGKTPPTPSILVIYLMTINPNP